MSSREQRVLAVLDSTLELGGQSQQMECDTPLLGALPELDSMAVVWVIQALEQEFGIYIEDDEVSAALFESVGTLVDFIDFKLTHTS